MTTLRSAREGFERSNGLDTALYKKLINKEAIVVMVPPINMIHVDNDRTNNKIETHRR